MPIDTSIYSNLLRPPKSMAEYDQEAQTSKLNALQLQQGQMKQDEYTRGIADQNALREIYKQSGGDAMKLQQGLYGGGFGKQAQETAKFQADIDKERATAKKTGVETTGLEFDQRVKKSDTAMKDIAALNSPEEARAGIMRHLQAGDLDQEKAQMLLSGLPQNPADLPRWQLGMLRNIMSAKEQLELDRQRASDAETARKNRVDEGQKSANDIMMPDGNGGYMPNKQYIVAKAGIAKSGASNINISTDKSLLTTMAKGLGEQLDTGLAGANSAAQTIQNAQTLKGLLNNGKVIAGPGADTRILLTQIGSSLGIGGKDDGEKLANTRLAMQAMARSELDAAQSMKGQGAMSDSERALVKRAAGGDINMTTSELRVLADGLEKSGRARIKQHQTNVERLGSVKGAETLMPFYRVDMPAESPAAAPAPAAGGGWSITPVK